MNGVGLSGRIAAAFLDNKLTPLLVAASLLLGVLAVLGMPREEEPQIVVPMMDVTVSWPGASAAEVERLVTVPIERSLREIPEVEYTYAMSRPSGSLVVARFYVGSDPERALVRTRDRVASAARSFPPGVLPAEVVPRSIETTSRSSPSRSPRPLTTASRSAAWRRSWRKRSAPSPRWPRRRSTAGCGGRSAWSWARRPSPRAVSPRPKWSPRSRRRAGRCRRGAWAPAGGMSWWRRESSCAAPRRWGRWS